MDEGPGLIDNVAFTEFRARVYPAEEIDLVMREALEKLVKEAGILVRHSPCNCAELINLGSHLSPGPRFRIHKGKLLLEDHCMGDWTCKSELNLSDPDLKHAMFSAVYEYCAENARRDRIDK